jgi:hypothetical protein
MPRLTALWERMYGSPSATRLAVAATARAATAATPDLATRPGSNGRIASPTLLQRPADEERTVRHERRRDAGPAVTHPPRGILDDPPGGHKNVTDSPPRGAGVGAVGSCRWKDQSRSRSRKRELHAPYDLNVLPRGRGLRRHCQPARDSGLTARSWQTSGRTTTSA